MPRSDNNRGKAPLRIIKKGQRSLEKAGWPLTEAKQFLLLLSLTAYCRRQLPHLFTIDPLAAGSFREQLEKFTRQAGTLLPSFPAGPDLGQASKQSRCDTPRNIYQALSAEALSLFDLINIFELLNCTNPNQDGRFYTPARLAQWLCAEAIATWDTADNAPIFLDPACGGGVFLLTLWHLLAPEHLGFTERSRILSSRIFGVDKDPAAVAFSQLVLSLALLDSPPAELDWEQPLDLSANIKCGHSLLEPAHFDPSNPAEQQLADEWGAFNWQREFPIFAQRGGFDVIVGNPPYGLSRAEQLSAAENAILRRAYRPVICGKVNKYLLFVSRSRALLTPGGVLSFIVPNAWLGIKDGTALRTQLLRAGALWELSVFTNPVFTEASVEAVVFKIRRDRPTPELRLRRCRAERPELSREDYHLPMKFLLDRPESSIPALWHHSCAELLPYLNANGFRLGDPQSPFQPAIALQAYAVGQGQPPQTAQTVKTHPFHFRAKVDESSYPYLEGIDVKRYQVKWSGNYLRYGPWLADPQQLSRFTGPRLLLREILNPPPYLLNTAWVEETMLYNKSVLHILARPGTTREHMLALLAILNSTLASYIIRFCGKKSQRRLFPKIVNADLKDFPLPQAFLSAVPTLAQPAQRMLESAPHSNSSLITKLQLDVDQAVGAAYGLSTAQMGEIAAALEIDYWG